MQKHVSAIKFCNILISLSEGRYGGVRKVESKVVVTEHRATMSSQGHFRKITKKPCPTG